jgi:hypothetical protein
MNATTFFSVEQFHQLKQDITEQKLISIFETPYRKEVKTRGNRYELSITTGRYVFGNNDYFISLWHDYNYANDRGSRDIGGGSGSAVNLDSYEAFTEKIDNLLKRFPDYTEPTFEPVQLSLFY